MTDKIKLRADKFVNDKKLKLNYIKPKDLKLLLTEFCEEQIAELKAECDLALEGRDIKIRELEEDYKTLMTSYNILKDNDEKVIKEMGKQIDKMECCGNCRFGYCERSSECIEKDGNRTFHCWNEEKEKYCDVGKNGKYQCWELAE